MNRSKGSLIRKVFTNLTVTVVSLALGHQAAAYQGVVLFSNIGPFLTPGDRLVYDPITCAPLVGTNRVAALYFGIASDDINNLAIGSPDDFSLLSAIARFRNADPTHFAAATWGGGNRLLPGTAIGQTLWMQVRVWDLSKFATFDDARAMGGFALASAPFSWEVTATSDPLGYKINNFQGITPPGCVPEPSVYVLGLLGGVLLLGWQRIDRQHGKQGHGIIR